MNTNEHEFPEKEATTDYADHTDKKVAVIDEIREIGIC
jgi:hypothetical protein